MRITLRSQILALAILALAAVAPVSVKAQSRAKVPFNFVVAGKTLPAGTYSIAEKAFGVVSLEGEGRTISWIAMGVDSYGANPSLTFDHRGDTYYLRTVQYGRLITTQLDSKTKAKHRGAEVAMEGQ